MLNLGWKEKETWDIEAHERRSVKLEEEIGVMLLQAEEHQALPAAGRSIKRILP